MLSTYLWEDEHFGKLSDKAKLLFIACITNADDEGRLSGNPANLRAIAFRFEDIPTSKIEELINEIKTSLSNFKCYTINDCRYIQFLKWKDYQQIRKDREKPSKFPLWQPNDNQKATKRPLNLTKPNLTKPNRQEITLVEKWNSTLQTKIRLTPARQKHITARLKEGEFSKNFELICQKVKNSDFLMGKNPSKGHEHWKATFDWIIKNEENYVKVLEGNYDNKTQGSAR